MSDPMSTSQSGKDVAKEKAAGVGTTAKDSAQQVAGTATEQAGQVASEVSSQARQLAGEAKTSALEQTNAQRDKAVTGLRSLGSELSSMADKSDEGGLGAELARQASQRVNSVAEFLDGREPGDLLEEVRSLARRRPGAFLIGAAAAGALAGRLTRGAVAAKRSDDSAEASGLPGDPYAGAGYTEGAFPPVPVSGTGYDTGLGSAVPLTDAAPAPYTTEVEPGPYETTHGIDATGAREPTTGPLSGDGREGRP